MSRMRFMCFKRNRYKKRFPHVQIAKDVYIAGNVTVGAGTRICSHVILKTGPNSIITIGQDCVISYFTAIRSQTLTPARTLFEKDILIENNVFISSCCYIREGTIIGANSYIGANTVVCGIIPANSLVYREAPLKVLSLLKKRD